MADPVDPTFDMAWPPPEWSGWLADNGINAVVPPPGGGLNEYGVIGGGGGLLDAPPPVPATPDVPPVPITQPYPGMDANAGYAPLTPFAPGAPAPAKPAPIAAPAPAPQADVAPPPLGGTAGAMQAIGSALAAPAPTPGPTVADTLNGIAQPGTVEPWQGWAQPAPMLAPSEDPWANAMGGTVADHLGGIAEPVQPGTDEAIAQRQGAVLAGDPGALAADDQRLAKAKQDKYAQGLIDAAHKAEQALAEEKSFRDAARARTQQQLAQLQTDAKALADGGYGWAKMDTGQKLLSLFSVFAGGMYSSLKMNNGQNVGAQIVQKNIEEDLQARQQGINMRRQVIGEQSQQDAMDMHAMEAQRLAGYETAIRGLQAEMMKYDPGGTAANNIAHTIVGVRQLQQQSLMAYQQFLDKHNEADAKVLLDKANTLKAQAEAAKIAAKGTGTGGGVYSRAELVRVAGPAAQFLPPVDPKNPNKTYSEKEVNQALETAQKALGVRKAANDPIKEAREVLVHGLVDESGQPFLAPDGQTARELRQKKTAAELIVKTLDEIDEIRDQSGGESSWGNSEAYQRLKTLEPRLAILAKQGTQGMSSDEDMKNLRAAVGADDLTTFRSIAARLKEARERTVDAFNTEAHTLGAKPIEFPRTRIPHTDTEGEKKYKEGIRRDELEYGSSRGGFHRDPKTGQVMFE